MSNTNAKINRANILADAAEYERKTRADYHDASRALRRLRDAVGQSHPIVLLADLERVEAFARYQRAADRFDALLEPYAVTYPGPDAEPVKQVNPAVRDDTLRSNPGDDGAYYEQ